jgi:hypothetical protein
LALAGAKVGRIAWRGYREEKNKVAARTEHQKMVKRFWKIGPSA